jgi:competence protein ComEA
VNTPAADDRFQLPRRSVREQLNRRFDAIRDDSRVGVALLAAIAIGAGVFWYRGATAMPTAPSPPTAAPSAISGPATPTTVAIVGSVAPIELVVHVAGAVRAPGVVRVRAGSRVVDAIDAAGGPLADADPDRLNLAAPIADGDRVFVARIGDPPTPTPITHSGGGASSDPAEPVIINLNTATAVELETLPGIGPTLAAAILAERDRRGGFTSVDDLRSVRGIGEGRFADLRDLVTV